MGVFRQIRVRRMPSNRSAPASGRSAPAAPTHPRGDALEPIAGVDLETYAAIVRAIAPHGYDQSLLASIAATRGISADDWSDAHDGWNARIESDPTVAREFSSLYRST